MFIERLWERRIVTIPGVDDFPVILTENAIDCIDGRKSTKLKPRITGAIRRPGASGGKVMTVLAVSPEISAKDAVDLVADYETESGRKFSTHTAEGGIFGCGHVDLGIAEFCNYGINHAKIVDAITYARTKKSYRRGLEVLDLEGVHQEAAVVIVDSMDRTIGNGLNGTSVFRYDRKRDEADLYGLARYAQLKGHNEITGKALVDASRKHTEISVGILAQGLTTWVVHVNFLFGPRVFSS